VKVPHSWITNDSAAMVDRVAHNRQVVKRRRMAELLGGD
jgi:hypothetical protein